MQRCEFTVRLNNKKEKLSRQTFTLTNKKYPYTYRQM